MIRSLIIDDEPRSRETLSSLLNRYCKDVSVEAKAGNVSEGVSMIRKIKPELIFLDISMPDGNGFDLLQQVPGMDAEIIFTTAYNEYCLQAIKASAVDYLLKPLNIAELQTAVERAEERIMKKNGLSHFYQLFSNLDQQQNHTGKIAVPVNDGLHFISIGNIIRMEASGSYTQIFCTDNTSVLSSKSLKEYEDILPTQTFFRVHHSHIINLSFIRQYHRGDGGYVTMTDGSAVDIAKRKRKDFLDIFQA